MAITNTAPVIYKVLEKKINRGSGLSYVLKVLYNDKKYWVDITEKTFYKLDNDKFPDLYYSETLGTVITNWESKKAFRIFMFFSMFFSITIIMLLYPIVRLGKIGNDYGVK